MGKFMLGVLLLISLEAQASDAESMYSDEYIRCNDVSNGSTPSIVSCINDETKRQDEIMTSLYFYYKNSLKSPKQQRDLLLAQRSWIKFKETHCAFARLADSGTIGQIFGAHCLMDETIRRRAQLEFFLSLID